MESRRRLADRSRSVWLREGSNTVGSDPRSDVALPSGPRDAGLVELRDGKVRLHLRPEVSATINDKPLREAVLADDRGGRPDLVKIGGLTLFIIERSGRFAIRLKDKNSPMRRSFQGMVWFPVNRAWRVAARFTPDAHPMTVSTAVGGREDYTSPGYVVFEMKGRRFRLTPVLETPRARQLFFNFKDRTSGKGTYPAGRFLYTDLPVGGTVVLDFNRAENPPCAVTPYATCPLPPKENRLDLAIEAGERYQGHH